MLTAGMEKINLTRWNLTVMRSPLLRCRKTSCPRSGWGRDGLTTSHGGEKKKKKRNLRVSVGWKLNMSQWQVVAT